MSAAGSASAEVSARAHNLIPLRDTFIADCETPVSAFLKLRALAPGEPAFLLESAEQGQRMGRYSFIGFRPRSVLRWSLGDPGDPYALAAAAVAGCRQAPLPDGVDGSPFNGGAVGFFGYDLVRTVEPLGDPPGGRDSDPLGLPDMALMLTDALVVFDHLKHTITILANADLDAEPDLERARQDAARTIAEVRACLAGPVPPGGRSREGAGVAGSTGEAGAAGETGSTGGLARPERLQSEPRRGHARRRALSRT